VCSSLRFCISAFSALKWFSAFLHLCDRAVHAKRFNRADPFNPSNPCLKMLMPTRRAGTRSTNGATVDLRFAEQDKTPKPVG
jgi:hypothetical protein